MTVKEFKEKVANIPERLDDIPMCVSFHDDDYGQGANDLDIRAWYFGGHQIVISVTGYTKDTLHTGWGDVSIEDVTQILKEYDEIEDS